MIVRKTILLIKGALHFCIEKKCHPLFSNKIVYVLKGSRHFCTRKKCHHLSVTSVIADSENAHHLLLLKSYYCNHLLDNNAKCRTCQIQLRSLWKDHLKTFMVTGTSHQLLRLVPSPIFIDLKKPNLLLGSLETGKRIRIKFRGF